MSQPYPGPNPDPQHEHSAPGPAEQIIPPFEQAIPAFEQQQQQQQQGQPQLAPTRRSLLHAAETDLADGEWHHLHPLTPLLKGGIFVLAILGIVIANMRERLIEMFVGTIDVGGQEIDPSQWSGDPVDLVLETGIVGWVLLGLAAVLIVLAVAFYVSWRMHTFRVTEEVVEVRSGVIFRTSRKARLDRIQGINVNRPLIPRLVGAAKLEVSVAGQNANVQLVYLNGKLAEGLRRDILHLASGSKAARQAADPPAAASGVSGLVEARVNEFLAPELDRSEITPESLVSIPAGRLLGSIVLSVTTIVLLLAAAAAIVGATLGYFWTLFAFLPAAIGLVGFTWSRFTKSLRYTIARTPDGVRIGHGLLSTSSETIPPGRVHAIEVSQPLLWRGAGWWTIRINTADNSSAASSDSNAAAQRAIVLPVGRIDDVEKVLGLIVPGFESEELRSLVRPGMIDGGHDPRFITSPRRARWLRPFSWRRTGYVFADSTVLLRRGVITRSLILVPLARLQSVALERGPIRKLLQLSTTRLHTVAGPVVAVVPAMDADRAVELFEQIELRSVVSASADAGHHWRHEVAQ